MSQLKSGFLPSEWRNYTASTILFFIFALAPLVTIFKSSSDTNFILALVQFLFFVIFIPESFKFLIDRVLGFKENYAFIAFITSFLVLILFSAALNGGLMRSFFYFSNALFFISLVAFFSNTPDCFWKVLGWKVVSVFAVCLIFLLFRVLDRDVFYISVFKDPPVYRHLRHLNYDLMIALGASLLLLEKQKLRLSGFLLLVSVFAVFSLWTGGRGQLVSLAIFIALCFFYVRIKISFCIFIIFLVSFLLIWVSGETEFMFGQIEKTFEFSSINSISTGRWQIWQVTFIEAVRGGWAGLGADQFKEFYSGFIVHPHNSVLQFFFEYGFLGVLLTLAFLVWSGAKCLLIVFDSEQETNLRIMASFILSMYAFSLVDGIFYHAIPFSFMVFIAAGIFVHCRKDGQKIAG
tara:strand:- start:2114 stop:3331 length:1218 start_codon:yes stop_codon:yes gene_type:complete